MKYKIILEDYDGKPIEKWELGENRIFWAYLPERFDTIEIGGKQLEVQNRVYLFNKARNAISSINIICSEKLD